MSMRTEVDVYANGYSRRLSARFPVTPRICRILQKLARRPGTVDPIAVIRGSTLSAAQYERLSVTRLIRQFVDCVRSFSQVTW